MTNALNLQEINQEASLSLLRFYINAGKNCFLFGRRGVGKTQIALQAAQECGYQVIHINLSVLERTDLIGLPTNIFDNTSDVINYKLPFFLPKANNNIKPVVLLFDELDKCNPELTSPLLEILQFKKINGTALNIAGCILTGNLIEEHAGSSLISTALLDRGAKYILSFDFQQWLEWAKNHQVHDLILGFLRSNPELAIGKTEDTCYASPSPRGWTLASEALIKARELKIVDIETVSQVVSGFVGYEAGFKFRTWYEYFRQFEPHIHSLIEKGEMNIDFTKLMPTEQIVFVISACHHAKQKTLEQNGKGKNKWLFLENLCRFLKGYKVASEMQVIGLSNSFSFEMITNHKLYSCKEFFELFTKINEGVSLKK